MYRSLFPNDAGLPRSERLRVVSATPEDVIVRVIPRNELCEEEEWSLVASRVPPISSPGAVLNPWRYNSSAPTNNTTSYDLWTDILINGKAVRICNWNKSAIDL